MNGRRFLRELVALALLSIGLALLLLPALAIANGSADLATWPPSSRQAFPIMVGAFFVTLGLADLVSIAAGVGGVGGEQLELELDEAVQ